MIHIAQHYMQGTPQCAAMTCEADGTVTTLIASTSHGESSLFRITRPSAGQCEMLHSTRSLCLPPLASCCFVGPNVAAVSSAGALCVIEHLNSTSDVTTVSAGADIKANAICAVAHTTAVATTDDGALARWDMGSSSCSTHAVRGIAGLPLGAPVAAGGQVLLATCRNRVLVFDLRAPCDVQRQWKWNPEDSFTSVACSGSLIVGGTQDGQVVLLDWRSELRGTQPQQQRHEHAVAEPCSPVAFAFAFDEGLFMTQSANTAQRLWKRNEAVGGGGPFPFASTRFYAADQVCVDDAPLLGTVGAAAAFAAHTSAGIVACADDSGMVNFYAM